MNVLQAGDWVGRSATAFYQEMGGEVMPSVSRLAGALELAQRITVQISQISQQAEVDMRPDPRIPPEGIETEYFQKGGVQVATQWTHTSRRLRSLVLKWEPAAIAAS